MTTILHGIPNCDTIKKARKWLSTQNIEYTFHDFRKDGIAEDWVAEAESHLGWEVMLNKRGTTFRHLSDVEKKDIDTEKAIALMVSQPAMIKRPVLEHKGKFYCGFSDTSYTDVFSV